MTDKKTRKEKAIALLNKIDFTTKDGQEIQNRALHLQDEIRRIEKTH